MGTAIKTLFGETGNVEAAYIERYIDGKMVSKFTLTVGSQVIIKPLNKRKLKHFGRKVQVVSFIEQENPIHLSESRENVIYLNNFGRGGKAKVNIMYLDTFRPGVAEIADLDVIQDTLVFI